MQRVDVNEYIEQGTLAANPVLEHGDVIRVEAVGKALVLGEVRYPASYDIGPEMDILDLIAQAGGAGFCRFGAGCADPHIAKRPTSELLVNVQALLSGRVETPLIQRNDVVFVPARAQVIILGAVLTWHYPKEGRSPVRCGCFSRGTYGSGRCSADFRYPHWPGGTGDLRD